jgi:hypothetical protein
MILFYEIYFYEVCIYKIYNLCFGKKDESQIIKYFI